MNEIDKEYILSQLNDGYIDLGIHDEKEIEYLKLVVSNYENLQSKIDKANEIIKDWHQEYNGLMETNNIYIPKDKPSLFDLRDILKEDK